MGRSLLHLALVLLAVARLAAGQGLPPGCNYDSTGAEMAALGLSLDPNATWTGPLKTAEVGPVDFAYYEFGANNTSGPTVVLITGFGTTMAEWGPVLPQLLAQGSRVFMFDNPGQGLSLDSSSAPLSVEGMASATKALLEAAGVAGAGAKPVLLGWSMGGMVALSMAQQWAHQYAGLVLVGTTAGGPDMVFPDAATVTTLTSEAPNTVLFNYSTTEGLAGACAFLVGSGWMSEALGEGYPNVTTAAAQAQATYAFESSSGVYDALPSIRLPTLVVTGEDDLVVPPENAQTLVDRLPNAQLYEMPGAGHGAWAQDTPAFAARVNEFIASLASAGTAPAPAPYSAALPAAGLAWLAAAALAAAVATVV